MKKESFRRAMKREKLSSQVPATNWIGDRPYEAWQMCKPHIQKVAACLQKGIKIWWVDESIFQPERPRLKVWGDTKKRVHLKHRKRLSKKIGVIAALSSSGELIYALSEGWLRKPDFWGFLSNLKESQEDEENAKKILYVWDQASFHKTPKDWPSLAGMFNYALRPVASPEIIPIEFLFNVWKHKFYQETCESLLEVKQTIVDCASGFTQQGLRKMMKIAC